MNNIDELLAKLDLVQLFAIGLMMWFFFSKLNRKIKNIEKKFKSLDIKLHDIDKRICSIKTTIERIDCCVLKE